jgi:LysM repeat protein/murein endopeptidase
MLSLVTTSAKALLFLSLAAAPMGSVVTPTQVPGATLAIAALNPLSSLGELELAERIRVDVGSLGALSIGRPNRGQLINGVKLEESELFHIVVPEASFGTEETLFYLTRAARTVAAEHEGTRPLYIGHLSRQGGGYLRPHKSHQTGRDVDVGFYYSTRDFWYRRATATNLDLPRTWTFLRALVTETDVEMIFVAGYIQHIIRKYAESIGEDRAWLHALFEGSGARGPIFRHAPGHATHFHVRFFSPFAERAGTLALSGLVAEGVVRPPSSVLYHRAKKGETLGSIARRYGSSVPAIQRENGLRKTTIQAKKVYRIPVSHGATLPSKVPARLIPENGIDASSRQADPGEIPSPP